MKIFKVFILMLVSMCLSAEALDYFLINGKAVKNAVIIHRTNNLVRILHAEGDNTYQIEYFTKDSQKLLRSTPVNHEKRKELESIKEAARKKRLERLQLKSDFKPIFPVVPYDIKYIGGNAASMSISNALNEEVRVDIISGRIVRNTVIMKPKEVKKRVRFRHQKGYRISIKAGDKTKMFDVE